jgi:hypothetical protein
MTPHVRLSTAADRCRGRQSHQELQACELGVGPVGYTDRDPAAKQEEDRHGKS